MLFTNYYVSIAINPMIIGVPRILQWRGFTRWGLARGLGDGSLPVGSMGKAPVEGMGDFVPQKLKQNVKLALKLFKRFSVQNL